MGKKMIYLAVVGTVGLILGLTLVWINIKLVDLSYSIKNLQNELEEEKSLHSKLMVEKMNLTSSYHLQKKARKFNLQPPEPYQVRQLDEIILDIND